jgi:hypothetical protein
MSDKEKLKLIQDIGDKSPGIRVTAANKMGESKDTVFIRYLMIDLDDRAISLSIPAYGMRVFCAKANALYKIHNIEPPVKLYGEIDTTILSYWKNRYPQYYTSYRK